MSKDLTENTQTCKRHNIPFKMVTVLGRVVASGCVECDKEREAEKESARIKDHEKTVALIHAGQHSKIPLRFQRADMADFNLTLPSVSALEAHSNSIFITGACGTGKTHLAVAILKQHILEYWNEKSEKLKAEFVNFASLTIAVKSSFSSNSTNSMDDLISSHKAGYRIFDDLCSHKPTETAIETVYYISNYRYENLERSIYTSNLTLEEIASAYGDRIASRLSACYQIRLQGKDRRLK